MKWIYLFSAIIFEVIATTYMKLSDGMTQHNASTIMFICYGICFTFLAEALKYFEVGKAYAIWSGLGTVAIVVIGIGFFKEEISLTKIICILLIILGVIGLHLSGVKH